MRQPTQRQIRRAAERKLRKQMRKGLNPAAGVALSVGMGLALAGNAPAITSQAMNFIVTNTNDVGPGSLRQAILDANANVGDDTITFQAGLSGTIELASGSLNIDEGVNIQGPGADVLAVDGMADDHVFYLWSGGNEADVTISGLTVTNGSGYYGGGIVVWGDNLTLDGVKVVGNESTGDGGGGIYFTPYSYLGSLTIRNCVISGNFSPHDGGGIFLYDGYATGRSILIENTQINDNFAYDNGGGIASYYFNDTLTILNSEISGNTSGEHGGGLYMGDTGGDVLIQKTRIADNYSYYNGGGIFMYVPDFRVTIDQCTISGNTAANVGGGIYLYDTDGLDPIGLLIKNSTLSGNSAYLGGGIFMYGPDSMVLFENTTISGNTALICGGIALYNGYAALSFCTVAGNTASYMGGGIGAGYNSQFDIQSSIVANNFASYGGEDLVGGADFDVEYSLIGISNADYLNDIQGNIFGVDSQLGPLTDNGGPTETMLPWETSPAINAADPTFVGPPTEDQRGAGYDRITNGRADMGAVEFGSGPSGAWNDFNGDGKSDLTIYYPLTGGWFVRSASGETVVPGWRWGFKGVKTVAGDFNGDGIADLSVFDLKTGKWYINAVNTASSSARNSIPMGILANGMQWGFAGAQPVDGDYDGDGICDPGVYNPFDGRWYIRTMAGAALHFGTQWGYKGASPVTGDYNGDGVADLTVYDPQTGMWYIKFGMSAQPTSGKMPVQIEAVSQRWGFPGSIAVPGDYDGDGRADLAVYSRFDGRWYILTLGGTPFSKGMAGPQVLAFQRNWGFAGAVPVSGDFNGDGISDLAVYNPTDGKWYIQAMDGTVLLWGQNWGGFKGAELVLP